MAAVCFINPSDLYIEYHRSFGITKVARAKEKTKGKEEGGE
jgi:hypothetical protein